MSNIGPALPPHLQNRHAATPESGSEFETGPTPAPVSESKPSTDEVGPALPPHILAARKAKAAALNASSSSSSSSSVAGPSSSSIPPGPGSGERSKKTYGPALPGSGPSAASPSLARPPAYPDYEEEEDDDDDDDDDVGPRPEMAYRGDQPGDGVREFLEREERMNKLREEAAKPKVMQREEWMLNPPEASDLLSKMDPTKLRSRGFSARTEEANTDMSAWTESPADKLDRLKNGKRKAKADAEEEDAVRRKKMKDMEIRSTIDQHNKSHRVSSLMDQHATATSNAPKGKEAPVVWDRDTMMGVTGKMMGEKDRSSLIKDARGLNDRFGHSKTGAYSQM